MSEIQYLSGDATRPVGDGQKIIVHCCNNVNAWGSGFVISLSRRWKEPERQYHCWYRSKQAFSLGNVQFIRVEDDILVANLIGQKGILSKGGVAPVRYGALRKGLDKVAQKASMSNASVHMPRMGCCRAGGLWETVEAIVKETLSDQDINVYVYDFSPGHTSPPTRTRRKAPRSQRLPQ